MVYRPREDSRLLKEAITRLDLEGKKFLDMGTGTGYIAEAALDEGAEVTAADIDPEAVEAARNRLPSKVDVIQSDLFADVQGSFDVVAFNPPYLPESPGGSIATVSGSSGTETSQRFLNQCPHNLRQEAAAVLIVSSKNEMATEDFDVLRTTNLWFEELKAIRVQDSF